DRSALERCRREHILLTSQLGLNGASPKQLFETDANFHEMLAEFSGNVFMHQSMQQQNRLRRLLEFRGYENRRRIKEWCGEHLRIIDAILANDMTLAADSMREHLSRAFRLVDDVGAPLAQTGIGEIPHSTTKKTGGVRVARATPQIVARSR
ncbi:MAG: FCD domain-containing protein, partial [Janthinobacterium lividum]